MSEQKFKVGDIVKGLGFERGVVVDNNNYLSYPLKVDFGDYCCIRLTSDGKYHKYAPHPAIELVERPNKKIKKTLFKFFYTSTVNNKKVVIESSYYAGENDFRDIVQMATNIIKVEEKEFEFDEGVL